MPNKQLTITIHGLASMNNKVSATIFQQKLGKLLRSLKEVDTTNNGKPSFNYVIADLRIGSAMIALEETVKVKNPTTSSVEGLSNCLNSLENSDYSDALLYGKAVDEIAALTKGQGDKFSHAEIEFEQGNIIRIDHFLESQAKAAIHRREADLAKLEFFIGSAHGSFDGALKEVDDRGKILKAILVLEAGGVEIECIFKHHSLDDIRSQIGKRAWIEGNAIYTGDSGLPARIDVSKLDLVNEENDISNWKESFDPFIPSAWEDDL